MNSNNSVILECEAVSKSYIDAKSELKVLQEVNFSLKESEQVAILGRSGSGKTTLLQLLGGLDLPSKGYIKFLGDNWQQVSESKRAKLRNQSMGFIYQMHHLLPEFSALENVAMPLMLGNKSIKSIKSESKAMLEMVGLKDRISHKPGELSGGERQRVAIARALITKPKCVLADELTGNLDYDSAQNIFHLMQNLSKEFGVAFVVVTHDLELANKLERKYKLLDGSLITC